MAFGRLERTARPSPMSDINMTPLIDVMLVLLVIFMITAPLMTASLKLDLPKAEGTSQADVPVFLAVAIDARGQLFVGDRPIPASDFKAHVEQAARTNPQTEVQLRADKTVPYGRVAELIGTVQAAGLNRIGFVAEPAAKAASQ
ncbi:biopolymer transporter ExbD [Rhizobacter sp. Root1221]|uniref:ExbD/TolR family protein n=1 Tax=Rhizobacter sp. Root1221 TaxID=1736433 RepID=UPI0006FC05D9|nr:biopolymer transporter ExbD [Rhizobacter sp. Root1221]KQV91553.1 biopolymer transporter ExbD [Rhizobacter sp. Root1221]